MTEHTEMLTDLTMALHEFNQGQISAFTSCQSLGTVKNAGLELEILALRISDPKTGKKLRIEHDLAGEPT